METDVIVALIGFGGVIAGAVITWLFQRGKNKADITQTITDTAMGLIEPLNKRIDDLEAEVSRLKKQVDRYLKRVVYLMDGISKLLAQIKELKAEPCWHPEEWHPDE